MTKHIEQIVPRLPVRDADRGPAAHSTDHRFNVTRDARQLVPVCLIQGLAPADRVAELRLRVRSGVYAQPAMAERVACAMTQRRSEPR